MPVQLGNAVWRGTLHGGEGLLHFHDFESRYTFASSFETGPGTNPEELLATACAGSFSMFLAALLQEKGFSPTIQTEARVILGDDAGPKITRIDLTSRVSAEGLEDSVLQEDGTMAKEMCPMSRLCTGAEISLEITLF